MSRWFKFDEPVPPDIVAMYCNAFNTVMDSQCREDASYQPHVDSIMAALLWNLAHFQKTRPDSRVSLPSNLSVYLSSPYFDSSNSSILSLFCDNWWLCSCLTTELVNKPPRVLPESIQHILRAIWEVAAGMTGRTSFSPPTPNHPSQRILEVLRENTNHPETISIIPLVQTAIVNNSYHFHRRQEIEFEARNKVPAYPTLAREEVPANDIEEGLTLSILDMRVAILANFIHQAGTLHSTPYKLNQTMLTITNFEPYPPGVSPSQQLNFAKSWKTAFEHDSSEGLPVTMVETIATCHLFQAYWDQGTTRFRWLEDREAAKVFIEGIDLAKRREDISTTSKARLAVIHEALTSVVDVHETQVEGGSSEFAIVTADVHS
ncbi:hypothetical protein R3P38DRAFT_3439854 [Favolaschia claudopus]|uniref:Uncharacterized protein n=1 Tax=Favolaschia claudopus TaxID=2862362 RepID=A0AAW0CVS3_9AGAR